jgi:large subunit ribosomal protein L30
MAGKVKITQVKSSNNRLVKQKRTLEALGLRGIRKSVIKEQNASLDGMIRVVAHIVKVEEVK